MEAEPAKRKLNDDLALVVKRQKTDIVEVSAGDKEIISSGPPRTSDLMAPIMLLTGHQGEIYTMKFNPAGNTLASGSFDKTIFLWQVFGECVNYLVLKGHQNAVLELHWSVDGSHIYSASADKTVAIWDAETGQRIKKLSGHLAIVNSCNPALRGPEILTSASDDATIKLWDARVKGCQHTFDALVPVTTCCFNDSRDTIFSGGLDNDIKMWDIRKGQVSMVLSEHLDTITGLSLSPDGSYLLSNSADCTLRVWDIRPYAPTNRCIKIFSGAEHNYEKNLLRCSWSPDGSKISCGSSDRFVYIWNTTTRQIMYRLSGHKGSVNEVQFHPNQPIIGSCSHDKNIFLGEIDK